MENNLTNNNLQNEKPQPIDSIVKVQVIGSFTEAAVTAYPPLNGGRDVTEEMILSELAANNIVYGIDKESIKKIVHNKLYNKEIRVAVWKSPKNGEDGYVTYHFEKHTEGIPKQNEAGIVDYKDLGIIRNTKAGTLVATITPPTDGEEGINIKNIAVPQRKGKKPLVSYGRNVTLSEDGTKMLTTVDGNLVYHDGRFTVETTFILKGDVDASTGNIDFIGDVEIKGNVNEGFKVASDKSIIISGNASGATIEANGDINIKNGAVFCNITAHGGVNVSFAENSHINCDNDLVSTALIGCEVYCGGSIKVESGKGIIMGGKYTCINNLTAQRIGSWSYVATHITIGDNAIMLNEKNSLLKKNLELDGEILKYTQAIDYLTIKKKEFGRLPDEKEELLTSTIKLRMLKQFEKKEAQKRIEQIDVYLQNKQNVSITCRKEIFPGTRITINDFIYNVSDVHQFCSISLGADGIQVNTL